MKRSKHYRRKPGDNEIRILPDGRIVIVSPDGAMLDVVKRIMQQENEGSDEVKENDPGQ
jgi:hypothetical protein